MLQKSRSKTISKLKFLVVVPLMLMMFIISSCSQDTPESMNQESSISQQLAEIKQALDDGRELTENERKQFYSIMEQVVKDNKNWPPPPPPPASGENNFEVTQERRYAEGADVPFAVVEQVPVFPGCESLSTNEEKKKCMSEKVSEYVTKNFDTSLGKKLGLTGVNRVIAVFKISPEGNITDVRARAPHPDLEVEAKRVIEGLPQMVPGEHNGKKIGVSYSLPIVFQVNE